MVGVLGIMCAFSMPTQAAGLDSQYTFDGQWVQSYSRNASIYMTISGQGVNQTVTLQAMSRDAATGMSSFWFGMIPADSVQVHGVNSVSVYVNTCDYIATYSTGCGIVDVTATSEPGWENFSVFTQASSFYTWDNLIIQSVGHIFDRFTSTTGSVNGTPLAVDNSGPVKTWMSRMGTANGVTVSVTSN